MRALSDLKHKKTGKYLNNDPAVDNKLNLVNPTTTGANVQWKAIATGDGTHYRIEHKASGKWLSSYPCGANFSLQPTTLTDAKMKWILEN